MLLQTVTPLGSETDHIQHAGPSPISSIGSWYLAEMRVLGFYSRVHTEKHEEEHEEKEEKWRGKRRF